ncbi:hypothetical protein KC345_g3400 [Hortaea werneckii]|nr:hypothetical protein KC345_g3400 [Hortaea werneckii]
MVKRALGICLIVVLASGLSILTTAYVVNTYIQSVLASFDIKLDGPGQGIGGFVKSLTGMGSQAESTDTTDKTDTTDTADSLKDADSSKSGGDQGNSSSPPSKTSEEPVEETVPEDALPVMGQAAGTDEQSDSALEQELVMTPDAMRDLKNNLPADEKSNIFNILMAKLPQEEMQKISAAMEDGLTESEVKDLQQVIAEYVDADEYDALMKMLTPDSAGSSQN